MVRERQTAAKTLINRSLAAYLHPVSHIAEQYRTIRNNIQYASDKRSICTLMLTSPSSGEGKSTSAVNLAISMAQRGERVLLIDVNIRNPVLHKIFNRQTSPGLTNVLAGQLGMEEAIQSTEIETMDLLTSGQQQYNSTELLDSQAMSEVMAFASSKYDRVILDCPPVLGVSDTNALVNKCDGVILLLQHGKTSRSKALEAKQALTFAGASIIGTILNKKG